MRDKLEKIIINLKSKRNRKKKTDVGNFLFLNISIGDWNNIPAVVFEENLPTRMVINHLNKFVK